MPYSNGFLRKCSVLFKTKNPFETLGLPRTATKAQIKTAYRSLAKQYHPDATGGDSQKMEEVNQAYKWLMKEGGYEQLQSRRGTGGRAQSVIHPVSEESERDGSPNASPPPLTEEEMEKLSALDPSTERRTPSGKFLYQSRDDGSWVELDKPLVRADQPRYASFAAQADFVGEVRRRQMAQEKEKNEKSAFQRNMDKLADSADLPSRNPYFIRFYFAVLLLLLYMVYVRTFARQTHHKRRTTFYIDVEDKREALLQMYNERTNIVEELTVATSLVFLAAAKKKSDCDYLVSNSANTGRNPLLVYDAVRPPPSHFHVIAGG